MSIRFYLGPSGSGKSTAIYDDILSVMKSEPGRYVYVITPDQFTLHTQKKLILRSENRGLMNIDILSFTRLAYKIFEEVGTKDRITLDDTGKNLILRKVAISNEDKLTLLKNNVRKNGYIHEIKSAISEFMQYDLAVEDVDKLVTYCKDKPLLSRKLSEINILYKAFLDFIQEKYLTTEEKMELLAREIVKSETANDALFVFDGFTGFTPVQEKVIASILGISDHVWMSFTVDEKSIVDKNYDETGLFGLTMKSIERITKMAKENDVRIEEAKTFFKGDYCRYKDSPVMAHLEKNIFRYPYKKYSVEEKCPIKIFSAISPREELTSVAITIKHLVAEQGYQYRDFAIVTGDLERYGTIAQGIFDTYSIPCFIDGDRHLGLNPFTEFIKSAMLIMITDFSYDAVIHFIKSGFTDLTFEEIDAFDNYIRALGIRGKKKYSEDFTRYPQYMKSYKDGKLCINDEAAERLRKINDIRNKIVNMLSPILEYSGKKLYEAQDITKAYIELVTACHMYEKLEDKKEFFKENGDNIRAVEYGQVYDSIMKLFEQIYHLMAGEEVSIKQYFDIFEAGLSEIKIGILPPGVDVCPLGDIQRTRLNDVKCLFFIGVNDGVIPKGQGGGGIISDIDREFLTGSGYTLAPSPSQQMYIEKFYLYSLLTSPSEKLYISYSKTDQVGASIRPSYLISNIKNIFEGLKEEDIRKENPAEDLYGKKDAKDMLSILLNKYAATKMDAKEESTLSAIYKLLMEEDGDSCKVLSDAAFYIHSKDTISSSVVKALYGAVLSNSISRLENFASCAYKHFLAYGLRLSEKEEYTFENIDLGNLYHEILENFGQKLDAEGIAWCDIEGEKAESILDELIRLNTASYKESVIFDSNRNAYIVDELKRVLYRTVMSIKYQLSKSAFKPVAYEQPFSSPMELSGDSKMYIGGKIDRIDCAYSEDEVYVKVVDYKSSEKKLKLDELYKGYSLQLTVYLGQAAKKVRENQDAKDAIPAAMFYYHIDDPIIDDEKGLDSEAIEAEIKKKLMVSGLLRASEDDMKVVHLLDKDYTGKSDVINCSQNKDGSFAKGAQVISKEKLNLIMEYASHKIAELGRDILKGNIDPSPCNKDTCKYCSFKDICEFDTGISGYRYSDDKTVNSANALDLMALKLGEAKK